MAPSATESLVTVPVSQKVEVTKQPETHVHGAEDKTPLEAISHGGLIQPGIPTFESHAEHRAHILIHTAATFRDFARKGFTEGMSGHISVRDPEFEHYIWMNPLGKHFGLMKASDLLCLDVRNGKIVGGNRSRPANAAGFLIHSEIHKARPDVHAVCHAHTMAGRAWSAFAEGLDMLNQDICYLHGAIAVYSAYGGIVFAEEEGRNIAEALGEKNKAAILMNHGLLSVGSTVDEAGFLFGLLDRGCQIQLQVEAARAGNPNLKKHVVSDEEAEYNFRMASEKNALYAEAQPDLDFEIEMAGGVEVIGKGVENMKIDHGL
ncbi:arad-like aldolase epimerase [Phlyctema vagabunda]|uniref:Arad-like aldolase epimerase n=1 Tax=Phlyctema vagabunda TaxID=108571 RepID=A0ABR4PR64_9HELO